MPSFAKLRAAAGPIPSREVSGTVSRLGRGDETGAASSASRVCAAPLPKARGGAIACLAMRLRLSADEVGLAGGHSAAISHQ